ncbi:MAG: hypothetical protein E2O58_05630 [Gammaproteobacteria bacterium]|nr:MAG: hypothetical protein E2O58_05630 [Gammaproteobacteria bacterium]
MTIFALDLNDSGLRLFRDLEVAAESPGFAIVTQSQLLLGDAARREFRLHPRQANNQFWHRLSMDPLAMRGPNVANHADLVYRHLKELLGEAAFESDDELILAVAGTTTSDQLGLLLGVAQELNTPITGLVDSAVAASIAHPVPNRSVHIDVSLHRATLTTMEADTELARRSTADVAELGLSSLLDAWVNVVADRFVTETRFDPLRIAETEQQLYDRIYLWAEEGAHLAELTIEIEHQGSVRRTGVSAKALVEKARLRYRLLDRVLDEGTSCILSHRAAKLPGLSEYLLASGHAVTQLEPNDVIAGIRRHLDLIRSGADALRFVTRLPCATGTDAPASSLPRAAPTHVVFDGVGIAIGDGLTLTAQTFADRELGPEFPDGQIQLLNTTEGLVVRARSGTDLRLNDDPPDALEERRALRRGDVLRIGEHALLLIRVDDGA